MVSSLICSSQRNGLTAFGKSVGQDKLATAGLATLRIRFIVLRLYDENGDEVCGRVKDAGIQRGNVEEPGHGNSSRIASTSAWRTTRAPEKTRRPAIRSTRNVPPVKGSPAFSVVRKESSPIRRSTAFSSATVRRGNSSMISRALIVPKAYHEFSATKSCQLGDAFDAGQLFGAFVRFEIIPVVPGQKAARNYKINAVKKSDPLKRLRP